jgi:formate dehydrogenase subunit delta
MSPDKLVYMANQIAKFFISQSTDKAAAAIADHLRKFWDPRMRAAIIAHLEAGGAGLDPFVRQAVDTLRSPPQEQAPQSRTGTQHSSPPIASKPA